MARNNQTPDASSDVTEIDETAPKTTTAGETAAQAGADVAPAVAGKRRWVTIHPGEGELGKFPVDLGINGYVIQIKRNEKVAIPEAFVQLMRDCAVELVNTKGEVEGRTPRFAFTDHGEVE